MEPQEEYLTIRQSANAFGKSDETIRRFIRLVRAMYQVDLKDTNEELEQKTPTLRKQNIKTDKNGVQAFDWLLLKPALEEHFKEEPAPYAPTHDDTHLSLDYPQEDEHAGGEDQHEDSQETLEAPREPTYISRDPDTRDSEGPRLRDEPTREDTQPDSEVPRDVPHEEPRTRSGDSRNDSDLTTIVVEALRGELGAKNDQIKQLHILLRQAQEKIPQLPSPRRYERGDE